MNSTSTEASASGRYTRRYSIGPSGITSAIVNAISHTASSLRGAAHAVSESQRDRQRDIAQHDAQQAPRRAFAPGGVAIEHRDQAPPPTSRYTVPGTLPSCSMPSVSPA